MVQRGKKGEPAMIYIPMQPDPESFSKNDTFATKKITSHILW